MNRSRKQYAAICEDATFSELFSRYGVHPNVIHRWKKEAVQSMEAVFSGEFETQNNCHNKRNRAFCLTIALLFWGSYRSGKTCLGNHMTILSFLGNRAEMLSRGIKEGDI